MTNKITHARSGNISDKKRDVIEGVELKIMLAQPYVREFEQISNKDTALSWWKSVPHGLERTLLLLLALNSLKDGI